jgi:hypothetical protein
MQRSHFSMGHSSDQPLCGASEKLIASMSGTMNPIVTKTVQGEKVCSNLGQSRPDHGMIRNEV